jgi:hypothetical protein
MASKAAAHDADLALRRCSEADLCPAAVGCHEIDQAILSSFRSRLGIHLFVVQIGGLAVSPRAVIVALNCGSRLATQGGCTGAWAALAAVACMILVGGPASDSLTNYHAVSLIGAPSTGQISRISIGSI